MGAALAVIARWLAIRRWVYSGYWILISGAWIYVISTEGWRALWSGFNFVLTVAFLLLVAGVVLGIVFLLIYGFWRLME